MTHSSDQTAAPLPLDEFKRLVETQLQAREAESQKASFPEDEAAEARLWMALSPAWTVPLAEACDFPAGTAGVEETLRAMAARGDVTAQRRPLAERARDAAPALYTMDNTARDAVLSRYLYSEAGLDRLRRTSAEIGRRMLAAAEALREAPAAVQRWAALAADAGDADRMAESFDRIVAEAFASGDQVTLLNWIESARALADLLERDLQAAMTLALQRASRRLELLERRQYDEQHLQHFLKRDEQIAAVVDLLEGPDDAWALHLVGAGGVGKTMLLRYITARMAPARGAPTARIDFDYLNADYPSLAPGLILWSFAQELRAYDTTGRANELFDEADLLLSKLHQRLESRRAYRAGQATGDPLFRDAVELYVHALRALPQPIILIMDTCEELAKLRPDGTAPESVEATFRILRGLHDGPATLTDAPTRPDDGVPTLRVIFAGRRLLAGEGYGWWCDACDLEARPFLRLYEMQAFTDQDARAYLKDAGVAEALIPAIIARSSPAPRTVLNIEWAAARIAPAEAPRCNPYDLALYAAWASEDPPPSAETIATASTAQYVELRIMRRLGDGPLRALMPAVALLAHFDEDTLRAVADADADTFEVIFERLRGQEWINQRWVTVGDGDTSRLVLDVEPGIQARLLTYFGERAGELDTPRREAADYLENETLSRDLKLLDWSYIDAALRVLAWPDPVRAARWWERLEARIREERGFMWARDLTGILLGEDGAAARREPDLDPEAPPESPLRPAVLATYASALLHTGSLGEIAAVWEEVEAKAGAYPVDATARRLWVRAVAGQVANTLYLDAEPTQDQVGALWRALDTLDMAALDANLAAALVAAAEAVVEYAEQRAVADAEAARALLAAPGGLGPVRLAQALSDRFPDWPSSGDAALASVAAFACALAGRALTLNRDYAEAGAWFDRALAWARRQEAEEVGAPVLWSDWLPPGNPAARVTLEYARAAYPRFRAARDVIMTLVESGLPDAYDIDGDRLLATTLTASLTLAGSVQSDVIDSIPAPTPPERNAHRAIPPAIVAAHAVRAAGGQLDALDSLRAFASEVAQVDLGALRHAEHAAQQIIRRMRLRDEGEAGGFSLAESDALEDQVALWALDALDGAKHISPIPLPPPGSALDPRAWQHAIWRTRFALTPQRAAEAVRWARDNLLAHWSPDDATPDFLGASLNLDLLEAARLAESAEPGVDLRDQRRAAIDPAVWWAAHQDQPAEALALWLRAEALQAVPAGNVPDAIARDLVDRLGVRRCAEIARDEGELLALRLPYAAPVVLERALAWFDASGDATGAVIAGAALAMVHGRLGAAWALDAALDRVRGHYDRLRGNMSREDGGSALPGWPALVALASAPTAGALDALAPRGWRPWLVRLVACLMRQQQYKGTLAAESLDTLRDWLSSHYGMLVNVRAGPSVTDVIIERQLALPAEFTGWFDTLDAEEEITRGYTPEPSDAPERPPVARLEVLPADASAVGYRSLTAAQAVRMRLTLPNGGVVVAEGRSSGLDPYRELANVAPGDVVAAFLPLRDAARTGAVEIVIQPDADLHGPAWEALVARGIEGEAVTPGALPYLLRREVTRSTPPRQPPRGGRAGVFVVASEKLAFSVVQRGWDSIRQVGCFELRLSDLAEFGPTPLMEPDVRILHVVGAAEESSAGVVLQPAPARAEPTLKQATDQIRGDMAQTTGFLAGSLQRAFPDLALCVIQEHPGDQYPRNALDRRSAALARTFAAELFARGVPAVLTLPSLEPRLAVDVLGRLASALAQRQRMGTAALHEALVDIRAAIRETYRDDAEAGWEAALDVCLYAIPDWNGELC